MSETVSFRSRSIAKELEEQDGEWDVDGMQTNSRGKMEPSRIQMKRSKHGLDGVMGSRRFRHEDPSEEAVAKLIVFPQHRTWKENHTSFWREQNHTLPIVRSVVPNSTHCNSSKHQKHQPPLRKKQFCARRRPSFKPNEKRRIFMPRNRFEKADPNKSCLSA